MRLPKPLLALFAVFLAFSFAAPTLAQTAPRGSCVLTSGGWCWPLTPGTYGEPCQCQTSDGVETGVTQ